MNETGGRFVSARVSPASSPAARKPIIGRSQSELQNINNRQTASATRTGLIQERIEQADDTNEIILDGLQLKSLPGNIFKKSLTKLYLHDNELVVIPSEISLLENLRDLSLENNKLSSLPKEIGNLMSLERFHCHGNLIVSLPCEIGKLDKLTRLFLSQNKIASLPPEIGSLANLQWLSLDNNQLTSLPAEFGCLTKLGWCSLESNRISSLPEMMGQLYSLEFLSLVDNPIEEIPESLVQLTNLKDVRTDKKLTIPQVVVESRNGRVILQFLRDVIARWDLDLEERAHWVPNEYSLKCCRCQIPFTFTKRRHHCRLCGLLFCNKDCDQVCDVPGMVSSGRVCVECYDIIDPLHPSNLYIQHCVRKAEKEANKYYGLAAGEEHLPLEERKKKIMQQLTEISEALHQAHNAQEGLNKLIDLYQASGDKQQLNNTLVEVEESEIKLKEMTNNKQKLSDLLRQLDEEDALSPRP